MSARGAEALVSPFGTSEYDAADKACPAPFVGGVPKVLAPDVPGD